MGEKLESPHQEEKKVKQPAEELKYVDMPTTDPLKEGHWRKLEGSGPKVEDPEKLKQPGVLLESTYYQSHFAPSILCRDKEGKIFQAVKVELKELTDNDEVDYLILDDRESKAKIRRPKKLVKPELTAKYADGTQTKIDEGFVAVYSHSKQSIGENEDFYEQSHFELRNHDFKLGDLVSFGNGVGRIALIVPGENPQFGIVAEAVRGKGGPSFLWLVNANLVDYIINNEKGAIRHYLDNTPFKPTLGNPEFPDDPGR